MKRIITMIAAMSMFFGASVAGATTIDLYESHAYSDAGTGSGNLFTNQLGSYTFHYTTAGKHYGSVYLDYEINEPTNTFFNEYGAKKGAAPAGLTWEIDEPGFGTAYTGDIYYNFIAGTLDNKIFNGTKNGPEDVAMALAWGFTLAAGESADLTFTASTTAPTSGFYLGQYDGVNGEDPIFLSAKLTESGDNPVPEPSTWMLLGAGLAGLAVYRRKMSTRS